MVGRSLDIRRNDALTSLNGKNIQRKGGQGFADPKKRREVEKAAVDHVTKHYESLGWQVVSRENENIRYDLLCTKDDQEHHVEVKGTSGSECVFIITANE